MISRREGLSAQGEAAPLPPLFGRGVAPVGVAPCRVRSSVERDPLPMRKYTDGKSCRMGNPDGEGGCRVRNPAE